MKEIRFAKHALEQCIERGTDEAEVCEAIQIGSREPAKKGRILCRANVQFNQEWQGQLYAIKQVAPVIVEEADAIVVITVYTLLFLMRVCHENQLRLRN